jgi:hypothetical protein
MKPLHASGEELVEYFRYRWEYSRGRARGSQIVLFLFLFLAGGIGSRLIVEGNSPEVTEAGI